MSIIFLTEEKKVDIFFDFRSDPDPESDPLFPDPHTDPDPDQNDADPQHTTPKFKGTQFNTTGRDS